MSLRVNEDGELEFIISNELVPLFQLRKCILASCGGVYNSGYEYLVNLPFDELVEHLDVYNVYQKEQRELQRKEMQKSRSGNSNEYQETYNFEK